MNATLTILACNSRIEFHLWSNPRPGEVICGGRHVWPILAGVDQWRPWQTPVVLAWAVFEGNRGDLVPSDRIEAYISAHWECQFYIHDVVTAFKSLKALFTRSDPYDQIGSNRVWDTHLICQLWQLAKTGEAADQTPAETWDFCVNGGLDSGSSRTCDNVSVESPDEVKVGKADKPLSSLLKFEDIPRDVLEQAALQSVRMHYILGELLRWGATDGQSPNACFGLLSWNMRHEQMVKLGWKTHELQAKAAIALDQMTSCGMTVDTEAAGRMQKQYTADLDVLTEALRVHGYDPRRDHSDKALRSVILRIHRLCQPGPLTYRHDGEIDTSSEALSTWHGHPFVPTLLEYRQRATLLTKFVDKLTSCRTRIHATYSVRTVTGRTSAYGAMSVQNLPRSGGIRECIVASPGYVLLTADYAMIDLVALAYAIETQFGWPSAMAKAIRDGKDLHRLVAAKVTGKSEAEVTGRERQAAKAINFGTPGCTGVDALHRYAQRAYDVDATVEEVAKCQETYFTLFPEIALFVRESDEFATGRATAGLFKLTICSYESATRQQWPMEKAQDLGAPHHILGLMAIKVLGQRKPATDTGREYTELELDYFWGCMLQNINVIPRAWQADIRAKRPSIGLRQAIEQIAQARPVMTLTGRVRANASFTACRNNIFQGLAADGAKSALWKLWRAGFAIVHFDHDEFLIEIPASSDYRVHAERVRELMIEGMQEVIPTLPIRVDFAVADRWYSQAEAVYDSNGRLVLWSPPATDLAAQSRRACG